MWAMPRRSTSILAWQEFGGQCNLRFDDTNPSKEETEYVEGIIEDVKWLGGDFGDRIFYASEYFGQLYEWAVQLIRAGKAYVCDLTADQVREQRGTLTEPGQESPIATARWKRTWICWSACARASFPMARARSAPKSTWRPRI